MELGTGYASGFSHLGCNRVFSENLPDPREKAIKKELLLLGRRC